MPFGYGFGYEKEVSGKRLIINVIIFLIVVICCGYLSRS